MPRRRLSISDALRKTIRDSGESQIGIARATGVGQGSLSRFLAGRYSLTLDTVDRLAKHLGLELRKVR